MKYIPLILLAITLFQCDNTSNDSECSSNECSQTATVKDLTGLDGCGLVLELSNGEKLIPERRIYIQAPTPEADPLYHFTLKAGDVVRISFTESGLMGTCMAGKIVFITCIKSCKNTTE